MVPLGKPHALCTYAVPARVRVADRQTQGTSRSTLRRLPIIRYCGRKRFQSQMRWHSSTATVTSCFLNLVLFLSVTVQKWDLGFKRISGDANTIRYSSLSILFHIV